MKKQILLLCLALISLCGYAQQITVKGVVTSATDQQPLIGTTVQVKGTGTGTITGIDGDYTLPNVDKNAVLVFSSIGFESQEIAVGGRTTINVVLKEAAELLDEVVVIGYGAVKKSDLTSSIATVKGDEITETVTGNAMDALQGKVNGVQVTSGGGPGATETGATVPSSFARPAPPTTQILFDLIVFDDQGKVSLACAFSAVYCTTRPNSLRLIWESAAVCRERFSTLHNFSSIHRSSPDSTQIRSHPTHECVLCSNVLSYVFPVEYNTR